MSTLVHLIYVSGATVPFTDLAVRRLLAGARRRNAELGVTGLLLHVDRSFFQILEGEPGAVHGLFDAIGADRRHAAVVKLIEEPIERRDFADWSMGLAKVTSKDLASLPGFSDFFASRRSLDGLGEGRARELLRAFREGRWRARVGD